MGWRFRKSLSILNANYKYFLSRGNDVHKLRNTAKSVTVE